MIDTGWFGVFFGGVGNSVLVRGDGAAAIRADREHRGLGDGGEAFKFLVGE